MAFPRRLLAEHENLVFDLKPHWVALVPPVFWTVVLGGGVIAFANFVDSSTARLVVGLIAAGLWLFLSVIPTLRWQFTNFVLTTDRLITRSGVLAKESKEIPLERINDVAFHQSVLERMLGAGDLLIESAGERGQNRIANVRKPEHVQLSIYKEVERNNERMMSGRSSTGAEASIPEQLEALARLKKQGVISDMEFENKKQDLLKRM